MSGEEDGNSSQAKTYKNNPFKPPRAADKRKGETKLISIPESSEEEMSADGAGDDQVTYDDDIEPVIISATECWLALHGESLFALAASKFLAKHSAKRR